MSKSKTGFQLERLAFFSDAVFAIAITLLIIEIHPKVFGPEVTPLEAFKQFLELIPEFIAVIVSFLLISMNWRRHHQLFGILTNYDEKLITLNFLSLLCVIFLPFSTAFVAKNWQHFWFAPLTLPFVIYSLNNLACAFSTYLLFSYALKPEKKLFAAEGSFDPGRVKLEMLFTVMVFTVTTIVGVFNHYAAIACFALFSLEPLFIKLMLPREKDE